METQLANAAMKLRELHKKRKLVEEEIADIENVHKKLSSTFNSSIFQCCAQYFIEGVARLIFDYLNLAYCQRHDTHFPNVISQCLGCSTTPNLDVHDFICEIGPLQTKKNPIGIAENCQFP